MNSSRKVTFLFLRNFYSENKRKEEKRKITHFRCASCQRPLATPAADHLGWTNKIVFLQEKNTQNLFYDFPPIGPGGANSDILKMSGRPSQANWTAQVYNNVFLSSGTCF